MKFNCERCTKEADCKFYGRPSDVEAEKAQNGEWLCWDCVPKRNEELGAAIKKFRNIMREGK